MGAGVAGFAAPGNAAVLVRAYGYAPLSSRTLRRLSCRRVAARGVRGTTNAGSEKRDAEADAPPASEETPARRPGWLRALRGIRGRVRALGVGGIIAYGMLNVVMYGTLIPVMVWRLGGISGQNLAKAWLFAWGISNATKPIRLAITAALAPVITRVLNKWRATRGNVVTKPDTPEA